MRLRWSCVATGFFFLLLSVFGSPAAHAAGVVSVCDEPHLQAALAGGGLVTFSSSCDIEFGSTITISTNTSIDGGGYTVTLDGQNSRPVLTVNSGVKLALNNLTVANGSSAGLAGAITNGGTLLITNSTFSNNTETSASAYTAGAIFNSGTLFISNSTFSGNSGDNVAPTSAGAICNLGQAILTSDTFSANTNNPASGAAFLNAGTATVTNSTFSGNTGGAIENGGTLTVINSTFSGNSLNNGMGGTFEGAAIYAVYGTATLKNTILVDSDLDNCASNGGTIVDGGYNLEDDGTCGLKSANHSLSDDQNANLGSLGANGGLTQTIPLNSPSDAIGVIPPGVNGCATTVPNDQRGVARPGSVTGYCSMGAYEYVPTAAATITDCSADTQLRTAIGNGGRIVFECDGTITLTSTLPNAHDTVLDANGRDVSISGGNTDQALYNSSNTILILHGLTIENGSGDDEGGGAQNAGTLIITDSTFANNFATADYGGGILHVGDLLIVTNSTFSGNSGTDGSAIYANTNGPIIVTGSTFSGNTITALNGSGNSVIYARETPVYLQNSLIAGNALNGGSECLTSNGSFTDLGYNLDDDGSCGLSSAKGSLINNQNGNPGSLSSNGGPTQTVPLTYPSSAIDAIPLTASACGVSPDQRGVVRPQGPACDIGAFEAKEIPVPFTTNPANLSYTVGSSTYSGAQVPFLVAGGEYPLSTMLAQSGGTGTQYVWENWSDSGGIEHTITIPSTPVSYTATFGTQYYLTMNASPSNGGNVSPSSGWQDANTVVVISASPSSGFEFSDWTGSTFANANSAATNFSMTGPETVTANFLEPPSITSANNITFTVGMPGTLTVTTNGYPTVTSIGDGAATLPSNVTFTNNGDGTATLSGTPATGTGGVYKFTITASNGVSPNASQSFTLTVDQAPAITSQNNTTFTVGTFSTFTVNTTGYPMPSIGESGGLPGGVMFVDNHNGTGTLSGTPTSGGLFGITFTASNGVGTNAVQPFTLTVDEAPVFTSANSAVFTIGVAGSFMVTTVAYPTASFTESGHLPTGLTFVDNGNGTATLAGTPRILVGGDFPITITAKNGIGLPVTESFTIIVQQAPSFTSANNAVFVYGVPNSFTVTTAAFPAASLHEAGTLPPWLTFVDNGNGTATLAGTPSYASGTFPLVLTATNAVTTATQNFTLSVSGLELTPSNLSFGSVYLNSSTTLPVTVTNVGSSTVSLSGVSITPGTEPAGTYTFVNHCGSPLAAGKSCVIDVTFKAKAEGTLTATLNLTDNAVGTPQTVGLTGNVLDPIAQFSPTKLAFGTQPVSSSTTLPVQLTNSGLTPLDISGIGISGSGEFTEVNNCPAILSSTMSCTISVTFAPTVTGARTGTLIVTDNVAGGLSTVPLTGTGH